MAQSTINTETLTILSIETGEAVKNINDLKNNIKELTKQVNEAEVGTEEYDAAVKELTVNQNALKAVQYGTTESFQDLQTAVLTTEKSYNTLVKQMASLKAQMRNVDISTDEGKARFADLAKQINDVNDELKALDAAQGSYVRNVGNYKSHWEGLNDALKDAPPILGGVKSAAENLDGAFKLMSTNPIMGVLTLLSPVITSIASGLKENKTWTDALNKAMTALKPVADFFKGILQTIAEVLGSIVDWLAKMASQATGTFRTIITGAVGVGNAVLQYLLTPFRTVIEVAKGVGNVLKDIFTGNFKAIADDAKAAGQAMTDAFKKGISFQDNFNAGKEAADAFLDGLSGKAAKAKAKDAGKAIAKEVADGFKEVTIEIKDDIDEVFKEMEKAESEALKNALAREKERLAAIDNQAKYQRDVNAATVDDAKKRADEEYRIMVEGNERKLAALREFQQAAIERGDLNAYLDYEKQVADLEVQMEVDALKERQRIRQQDIAETEAAAQAKYALMQTYSKGVGDVLGAIASLYDAAGEDDKRSFENSKRFQLANTWVNTLSGMASAIWATWNDKTIPSAIAKAALAATNAGTVLASGIAATAKIKATSFGSAAAASSIASAAAPSVGSSLPQMLFQQTDSDVARLDRAAEPSKVYILQSDIEAASRASRVRVSESTF